MWSVDKVPYDPSDYNQNTDFTYSVVLSRLKKLLEIVMNIHIDMEAVQIYMV